MSVNTDTKNRGSRRSLDRAHPNGWQNCNAKKSQMLVEVDDLNACSMIITHSMPSMNGVSGQSFSGKRCNILPLRFPLPNIAMQ